MSEELLKLAFEAMELDDRNSMLKAADALLARDPVQPEGLYVAGMAFFRMEQRGLASVFLNAASQVKPDQAPIWNNLACAMQDWHPKQALRLLDKALEVKPGMAPALSNKVSVLSQLGKWEESIAIADEYLKQIPDDPDVTYNSALVLMQLGRWKEAWPRWKAGLGRKFRKERNYHKDCPTPRWDGQGIQTGFPADQEYRPKVVIYGEQGLGDEILGAAMYERAAATGAQIVIECDERLEKLFARSFPAFNVYGTRKVDNPAWVEEEKPTHRLECIGLGELFAPEPFRVKPFLKADPQLRAMCRAWLDTLGPGRKVGIAWTGGVLDWDRAERNIQPGMLGPIITSPGCQFVSLEYLDSKPPAGVHEAKWATAKGVDYDLTCALIAELDLVISVPTTVVDAAGALGTPCWVMVPPVPQWRFAERAGDTAWIYDDVRIFRRGGPTWLPTTAKVAKALRALPRKQPQRMEAAE